MLLLLLRLIARLPLSLLHRIGRLIGLLVYAFPGKYRQRLQKNCQQAGYDTPAFFRQAAAETGAMIMETPKIWLRTQDSLARCQSDDEAIVHQALAENRGILYLTPHLGSFEITARFLLKHGPLTVMFRPPRQAFLEPVMVAARELPQLHAVPANMRGVREFVKALRQGRAVGMLPDQVPSGGDGTWAPFFKRPALTMTLAGKLALQAQVPVVLTAGERLPKGQGWRIHYLRLPEPYPKDQAAMAALINASMEILIRRFPAQYLWSYNRYKVPHDAPPLPDVQRYETE